VNVTKEAPRNHTGKARWGSGQSSDPSLPLSPPRYLRIYEKTCQLISHLHGIQQSQLSIGNCFLNSLTFNHSLPLLYVLYGVLGRLQTSPEPGRLVAETQQWDDWELFELEKTEDKVTDLTRPPKPLMVDFFYKGSSLKIFREI